MNKTNDNQQFEKTLDILAEEDRRCSRRYLLSAFALTAASLMAVPNLVACAVACVPPAALLTSMMADVRKKARSPMESHILGAGRKGLSRENMLHTELVKMSNSFGLLPPDLMFVDDKGEAASIRYSTNTVTMGREFISQLTDPEVCSVMGHEIAHLRRPKDLMAHFLTNYTMGASVVVSPLVGLITGDAKTAMIGVGIGFCAIWSMMKRSQNIEKVCDAEGMAVSGVGLEASCSALRKIDEFVNASEEKPKKWSTRDYFFSTHPPIRERIAYLRTISKRVAGTSLSR